MESGRKSRLSKKETKSSSGSTKRRRTSSPVNEKSLKQNVPSTSSGRSSSAGGGHLSKKSQSTVANESKRLRSSSPESGGTSEHELIDHQDGKFKKYDYVMCMSQGKPYKAQVMGVNTRPEIEVHTGGWHDDVENEAGRAEWYENLKDENKKQELLYCIHFLKWSSKHDEWVTEDRLEASHVKKKSFKRTSKKRSTSKKTSSKKSGVKMEAESKGSKGTNDETESTRGTSTKMSAGPKMIRPPSPDIIKPQKVDRRLAPKQKKKYVALEQGKESFALVQKEDFVKEHGVAPLLNEEYVQQDHVAPRNKQDSAVSDQTEEYVAPEKKEDVVKESWVAPMQKEDSVKDCSVPERQIDRQNNSYALFKPILKYDCVQIKLNKRLIKMPGMITTEDLLQNYVRSVRQTEGDIEGDMADIYAHSLRTIFNLTFGTFVLYKEEVASYRKFVRGLNYREISSQHPEFDFVGNKTVLFSPIYLLRLMRYINARCEEEGRPAAVAEKLEQNFLQYLWKNQGEYFSQSIYYKK